jgi:hypothetical protein
MLYVAELAGVPWNGLTAIQETPTGGDAQSYYFDGEKAQTISAPEEYAATITAYTYPSEFGICDGSARITSGLFVQHQPRVKFSFSYRTGIGNDISPNAGYKIHLVYNAMVAPSQRSNKTQSANADISDFSWAVTAVPISYSGFRPSSHFIIDTRYVGSGAIAAIENILYGDATDDPRMPTIDELVSIIGTAVSASFIVVDNGDGTFSVLGSDAAVFTPAMGELELAWPTVTEIITDVDYTASSS